MSKDAKMFKAMVRRHEKIAFTGWPWCHVHQKLRLAIFDVVINEIAYLLNYVKQLKCELESLKREKDSGI